MPIDIRELIIRTHILDEGNPKKKNSENTVSLNEKEIVDRCVEKVLRKLSKKTER